MGYRIHVASTYQVEYGDREYFSNQIFTINRFLEEHCPGMGWNGNTCEESDILKIPRHELAYLINWILCNQQEYKYWAKRNNITECPEEFVNIIAYWIAESDPRNDYVVLEWR